MAWLAALGGGAGAGAGALSSTAAGTAATAGAAEAAGAGGASAGSVGDASMGGTTAPTTTPAATPPSFADWLNQQGFWQNQVGNAMDRAFNQKPSLPSPITPPSMSPMGLPPMSGLQSPAGGDMSASAYAPFLQALARSQGRNRFGASPYGFGVPGAYFQ